MKNKKLSGLAGAIAGCVALLALGGPLAATSFDDPQQQQRYNDVVDLLDNDASPYEAMPAVYEYLEFYVRIGYSDGKFDPAKEPEGVFGEAYTGYFARMVQRYNKRLGQCDPTVIAEIIEYLEFHDVGYSDGAINYSSDGERIEKSEEFWAAYVEWKAADNLRDLLKGEGGDPTTLVDLDELFATLRQGDPKQKEGAARQLGGIEPGPNISLADLDKLLGDSSSLVRFWAATMLGRYGSAAVAVVEGLRQGLEDHSWPMRYACAQVLDQLGDRESAELVAKIFAQKEVKVEPWPRFGEKKATTDDQPRENGPTKAAPGGNDNH